MLNLIRMPRRKFAKWAKMSKPFTTEKHYINEQKAICYDVKSQIEYSNHLEMAGFGCAGIISYGCDSNSNFRIMRHIVVPTMRLYPNLTHSSLDHNFKGYDWIIDGQKAVESVKSFVFDGILKIYSTIGEIAIERWISPTSKDCAIVEKIIISNSTSNNYKISIKNKDKVVASRKIHGHNRQVYYTSAKMNIDSFDLTSNSKQTVKIVYGAEKIVGEMNVDVSKEIKIREDFIKSLDSKLEITTPNDVMNVLCKYTKLRASESIFSTKNGLMHAPGGGGFYAALWTNDQCEYVNPYFAYLGYEKAILQSINCYSLYKKYISKDKALITSIISEGDSIWHGAKDRGDSAMYAYGASRFVLTMGDKNLAEQFLKAIDDCLEFTISQINSNGVVASDSDELENRFLSGKANLCTSCIAYDALLSGAMLHKELNDDKTATRYNEIAAKLKENIEKYFGKEVEGYSTYMYCAEETKLRSWISIPLVVGIENRKEQTKNALLSKHLKLNEGLITRSGEKTFWDRSTLYSLRGLFSVGYADDAYSLLDEYSRARLLGEHIPYPVEAFPEGNQAQLSAESGLYQRIFIEAIIGFRPVGFGKFIIKPSLPTEWKEVSVKNMIIANKSVSIYIQRNNESYSIIVKYDNKEISCESGKTIELI